MKILYCEHGQGILDGGPYCITDKTSKHAKLSRYNTCILKLYEVFMFTAVQKKIVQDIFNFVTLNSNTAKKY